MFSLTVQYSICPSILPSSQSAQSHVQAQYVQNHSSHWNFHPRCVIGLGVPNQLHLMILHTNIISDSEAAKGSCVSSQTAKKFTNKCSKMKTNSRQHQMKASIWKKYIVSHTGGAIIPQGCRVLAVSRCEPDWRSWLNLSDHLESIWKETVPIHGSEVFHDKKNYAAIKSIFDFWCIVVQKSNICTKNNPVNESIQLC